MDKNFSPLHASFSVGSKEGVLHGEHSLLTTSLGNDGQLSYNKGNYIEAPNALSELLCNNLDREVFSSLESLRRNEDTSHRHSYSIQTLDLNEVFIPDCQMAPSPYIAFTPEEVHTPCLIEPAQGPSTPGLLEEVMPSNFQEIPALSPQERVATPAEPVRPFMEVEYAETGNDTGHTDTTHDSCLPSVTENTIGKAAVNEMNDVLVSDRMIDNREVILPSAISDETLSGAEPISSNFSTENVNNVDVSGVNWDAKTTTHNCTEPSNTSSLGRDEDIGSSCISGNRSGFHLRPCSSNLHLDVTLEGISELSHREQFCSLEIPIREGPHICESSREVQGLFDQSFLNSGVIEPHELSTCDLSKVNKPDHFHDSTSSEFREPEKMLAPACFVDLPNDRGQETAEKGAAESDVSVDRISSLHSKKRRLMDRSWQNAVPDDDDLLASILVGRKSQLLKIGTLLSPASSNKRPRTMSKVGLLKRRKVLVDDTMFLHAELRTLSWRRRYASSHLLA